MTAKASGSAEQAEKGYVTKEAIAEANRCLNCKKPTCQEGCPIANDIPEFIEALGRGNIGEASKIIARKSNLPAVCGRVCAHEMQCEGHCVLTKANKGIKIGKLERFIADFAFEMDIPLDKVPQKTRGKIGVIGSGPAGLTVAGDLAKIGFSVTVFEALEEPGGILRYGIPEFRLPNEVVRREIVRIEALGVKFTTNCIIGRDITVDEIFEKGYDALFIGSGTAVSRDLELPGRELPGIVQSSYLLRINYLYTSGQVERDEVPVDAGDKVVVVGAGNVGMDAARTAIRLGASKVTIIELGKQENMVARPAEYEAAIEDGVEVLWEVNAEVFVGRDGVLEGLQVSQDGQTKVLPADKVFLAIGARPANRIVSTTTGIDVDDGGYVITKERPYGMTTRKGVFAGGDVVHRPATVVLAMRDAKQVAQGMAEYVDAVKLLEL